MTPEQRRTLAKAAVDKAILTPGEAEDLLGMPMSELALFMGLEAKTSERLRDLEDALLAAPGAEREEATSGDELSRRYGPLPGPDGQATLGKGGMAEVVRMVDLRVSRTVAVKRPLPARAGPPELFIQEAAITARLEHPNIVRVYDIGQSDEREPYYAMQVVGRNLAEVLADKRTASDRLALLPTFVDALRGMAHAHQRRIVHRDLKPQNVYVGERGEGIVGDFGLGRDLDQPDPYAGFCVGTSFYCAPEAVAGRADTRADVYSLGVALLYMVLGGSPAEPGPKDKLKVSELPSYLLRQQTTRINSNKPHRLTARKPPKLKRGSGASRELRAIIEKATQEDPKKRYADAGQMLEDFERMGRKEQLLALRGPWEWTRHRLTRNPWITGGFTLAISALAVMLAMLLSAANQSRAQAVADKVALEKSNATIEQKGEEVTRRDEALSDQNQKLEHANQTIEAEEQATQEANAKLTRILYLLRTRYFQEISRRRRPEQALAELNQLAADADSGKVPAELESRALQANNEGFSALQVGSVEKARASYAACAEDLVLLAEINPPSATQVAQRGRCLVGVGDALEKQGHLAEAIEELTQADDLEGHYLADGSDLGVAKSDSLILSRRGAIQLEMGDLDAAEKSFQSSADRVALLRESSDAWTRDEGGKRVAVADLYLGYVALARGALAEARTHFQQALDIDEDRARRLKDQARPDSDVAEDLIGLARVDVAEGVPEAALPRLTRAQGLLEGLVGEQKKRVEWKVYMAKLHDGFCRALPG